MIILDEHRIIERETVVHAAACPDCIFLQGTQTGRRLAGADDGGLCASHSLDQISRRRGNAGQMAEKIERGALTRQDRAGRAGNAGNIRPFSRD